MKNYCSWVFPDIPPNIAGLLFGNNHNIVVVGVIGKSAFKDCNKMAAFDILGQPVSTLPHTPKEGQVQFFYKPLSNMLILHFETTYDNELMQEILEKELETNIFTNFHDFHKRMRTRFARTLLFMLHVCHVCVYVELNLNVDPTLLQMLRLLKIVREEHVQKFLPKLLKNTITSGVLGKSVRLCAPRLLLLFENYPVGYEKTKEAVTKLEFDTEDIIYSMLRKEGIITNNSNTSLISVPNNKQFVFFNTNNGLRVDVTEKSLNVLEDFLLQANLKQRNHMDDINDLTPFKGLGRPYYESDNGYICELDQIAERDFKEEHCFINFLMEHVKDALDGSFDDSSNRNRGSVHFELLSSTAWYEIFKVMHKIFIENPDNPNIEANDEDYKFFLENFDTILNSDQKFFQVCCEYGLKRGYLRYKQLATPLYSSITHANMLRQSIQVFYQFARGPCSIQIEAKLREMCLQFWENSRQACEKLSLRGNPCVLANLMNHDDTQHTSGQVFVSTCNCGRTQGRRDDPYSIRQANYEYYEFMAGMCNLCVKVKKVAFAIFEPSSSDYRAAEFEMAFPKLMANATDQEVNSALICENTEYEAMSQPTSVSFGSDGILSGNDTLASTTQAREEDNEDADSDTESLHENELVLQIKEKPVQLSEMLDDTVAFEEHDEASFICRQASTTEYLPGLIHTRSAEGLLPLFPSWSLVCVGASSIYSHNVGLMEHFQSGFLSGANFLLPWDVHVRLQHVPAVNDVNASGKQRRFRKKGDLIVLKVFVGFEYECARGHRFIMCAPDKVLRGGADIARDSGSNVVNNDMPLYYPCPCHSQQIEVAQLMRIHVVTPKAPVNVIMNPRVRTGEQEFVFTLGLPTPPRLTQSAYWILRLPYVYQGDDMLITPPTSITAEDALMHGCLLAGMFGVAETENEDESVFKK